jgi:hypothetical protein
VRRFYRFRVWLLEMAAVRGFYPAERRLQVIRETAADLPSHLAWKALRRLQARRYYARCAEVDAKRLRNHTRTSL